MATQQMITSTNRHNNQKATEVNRWGDGDDGNNMEEAKRGGVHDHKGNSEVEEGCAVGRGGTRRGQ
jgi:hypothetical protein